MAPITEIPEKEEVEAIISATPTANAFSAVGDTPVHQKPTSPSPIKCCFPSPPSTPAPKIRKNTESINLTNDQTIGNAALLFIVKNCKNLKTLNLEGCLSITAQGFIDAFGEISPDLKEVTLSITKITLEGLKILFDRCPMLETVRLEWSFNIDEKEMLIASKLLPIVSR